MKRNARGHQLGKKREHLNTDLAEWGATCKKTPQDKRGNSRKTRIQGNPKTHWGWVTRRTSFERGEKGEKAWQRKKRREKLKKRGVSPKVGERLVRRGAEKKGKEKGEGVNGGRANQSSKPDSRDEGGHATGGGG